MTQEQWIKKFSDELKKAQNKIIKLREIEKTINSLRYEQDNQPVSDEYKLKIWEGIENNFRACQKSFSVIDSEFGTESHRIYEATDNSEVIKMLGDIEKVLRG